MIFVTVGTHEQQFNRLLECVDKLIEKKIITEEVIAQIGYSTYIPKFYKYEKIMNYSEMQKAFSEANVVITHGGPSTFMEVISKGKIPIVVPRQKKYEEHVNNHQLDFCRQLSNKGFDSFILVEDISDLGFVLNNYNDYIKKILFKSNNQNFNNAIEKICLNLFGDKNENKCNY